LWAHFEGQRPEVLRMLERIETWRMWVLCDREPVKEWSKGRVTLLGDAAHPMLQYLAQGACMATEDAVRLAENASENPENLPAAFQAYVQQRYLRTARVQIMARVYGDFYHARGPAAELRNQMLGPRTPEQAYDGVAWLYGEVGRVFGRVLPRDRQRALLQPRDRAPLAGQLQNMHAGIGAVDQIDVAAVVGFHVVALDRGLAAVHSINLDAALVGRLRDRGDEGADLLRLIRVAHVDRAHAGIEVGDKGDLLVEHRRHALIRGMRAEASPTLAEISARLGHREIRHHHRPRFGRDIDEEHELARFLAFIEDLLVHDHHEITYFAILVLGEFRDRHFEHRENRVRAVEGQHVDLTDNRIAQILRRRFLRTVQKLFAVDDLQHAALVGAVAEIHAIALRAGRDRPMQLGRHRTGGTGLLSNQAERADTTRL